MAFGKTIKIFLMDGDPNGICLQYAGTGCEMYHGGR